MDDAEGSTYNNSHRAFLQAFLSRSVLTVDDIKPILAAILTAHERRHISPSDITPPDISTTINTLNPRLSTLDLEIRQIRSQHDRSTIYALVNTTSDPMTQLATTRSPDEIAYVKRVLDAMFEGGSNSRNREVMAVEGVTAARLARVARTSTVNGDVEEQTQTQATQGASLTLSQAEKVLQDMVSENWFERSRAGYYSLAPRALMELRGWLKETYNEPPGEGDDDDEEQPPVIRIRDCEACREIVTVGQRCSNRECECRLHDICTQHFFRSQRDGVRKCPRCKADWTGSDFVGEKAALGAVGAGGSARRRGGNAGSSSRRTTAGTQRNGYDEEEEE